MSPPKDSRWSGGADTRAKLIGWAAGSSHMELAFACVHMHSCVSRGSCDHSNPVSPQSHAGCPQCLAKHECQGVTLLVPAAGCADAEPKGLAPNGLKLEAGALSLCCRTLSCCRTLLGACGGAGRIAVGAAPVDSSRGSRSCTGAHQVRAE